MDRRQPPPRRRRSRRRPCSRPPSTSGRSPARSASCTFAATARTPSTTAPAFMARGWSWSARQRKRGVSPRSLAPSASTRPAALSAAGASSCPGANAPALVGAPMTAITRAARAALSATRANAAARSVTRSSGASIPQLRRTRSAGTAASEPSTVWCVIACGTSMSDSTPPSDSASVKRLRRLGDGDGVGVAEGDHAAEARPAHVVGAVGAAQPLRHRAGALGVRAHAHGQRAQPAVHEEAVERARARRRSTSARSAPPRAGRRRARSRRRR